jgi:hypothetical protein
MLGLGFRVYLLACLSLDRWKANGVARIEPVVFPSSTIAGRIRRRKHVYKEGAYDSIRIR